MKKIIISKGIIIILIIIVMSVSADPSIEADFEVLNSTNHENGTINDNSFDNFGRDMFDVIGTPDIWVYPEEFIITTEQGNIVQRNLTIGNNGTEPLEFEISKTDITPTIYETDFSTYPVDWTITTTGGSSSWEWNNQRMEIEYFPLLKKGYLDSPIINCSDINDVKLSFWHYWWSIMFDPPGFQEGYVRGSIDGGQTWPYLIDEFHHADPALDIGIKVYDLDWADNQTMVRIRFDVHSSRAEWFIDDFSIFVSRPEISWLDISPETGVVNVDENISAILTIDATTLEEGNYSTNLSVASNDPDENTIIVPINLQVIQEDHSVSVIDLHVDETTYLNEETKINSTIMNSGLNDETDITVQILINGNVIDETVIDELPTSEVVELNFSWLPEAVGEINVSVYVVPVPGEIGIYDNILSTTTTVISVPNIWVEPQEYNITIPQGHIISRNLTIGNNGTEPLEFEISDASLTIYETDFSTNPVDWTITHTSFEAWKWRNQRMEHVYYIGTWYTSGYLDSPIIDCSERTDVKLSFWHYWLGSETSYCNNGWVRGSIDGGQTWPYLIDEFHSGDPYTETGIKEYDLPWTDNQTMVRIRFDVLDWYGYWYIDDFNIFLPKDTSLLDVSPETGVVNVDENISAILTIDATILEEGDYSTNLSVASNDPDENPKVIPVNLHITEESENPPHQPTNPTPEDGAANVSICADLSWDSGDPDPEDTVVYYIYFEAENPDPELYDTTSAYPATQTHITYDLPELEYTTQYYWKIIAEDNIGLQTEGSLWEFTTEDPIPDLDCEGSLSWIEVEPYTIVEGNFSVSNVGDPTSMLDWEIESYPEWGTWAFTPASGEGLTPEDDPVIVEVKVVAPDESETEFTGEVKIINTDDPDDFCTIDVSLATPQSHQHPILSKIIQFLQNLVEHLFEQISSLQLFYN